MNKSTQSLRIILFNLSLLLFVPLCSFTDKQDTTENHTFRIRTIVIDAGHGGKDPGTHGRHANEKTVALSIAKKLRRALQEHMSSVNVVMTRTDDTFIPLNERSEIANSHKGNLFISIHCNSSPEGTGYSAHKQKGTMMLIYGLHRVKEQLEAIRENSSIYIEKDYKTKYQHYDEDDPVNRILINAYMQKYRKQSILFGDLLNDEFKSNNRTTLGVKEQGVLVLAHSAMPAVMVETGFINNPDDEDYLTSDDGQDEIVQCILNAIKTFKARTKGRQ
ncbi:MAG TPA: N-acetylmuramoyl-L-alanine amidase [Mucilaginibacter sp.]|nr:N-acetylmuramoyl-L-alanine amidase [Mucilaginibacter sp.]